MHTSCELQLVFKENMAFYPATSAPARPPPARATSSGPATASGPTPASGPVRGRKPATASTRATTSATTRATTSTAVSTGGSRKRKNPPPASAPANNTRSSASSPAKNTRSRVARGFNAPRAASTSGQADVGSKRKRKAPSKLALYFTASGNH